MHLLPYPHLKLDKKTIFRACAVAFIGIFASILLSHYIMKNAEQEDRLRFEYEAEILSRRISSWLEQYSAVLVQTRAFVLNADTFDSKKLYHYIEGTEVFKHYSGLQGIGYIPVLKRKNISKFKKQYPEINVWPNYDGKADYINPIVALYPFNDVNKKAIGFNVSSEQTRLNTIEKARDTNSIVATGKVVLVQESGIIKPPSFILFIPIYKEGADISNVLNRRKAITGYLYSPFRTSELFHSIFSEIEMTVDIKVYDDHIISDENLLFNYSGNNLDPPENKTIKTSISIDGMDLALVFTPLDNFQVSHNPVNIFLIFLLGSSATFVAVWTFLITNKQVMEARRVAAQKETLLKLEMKHVQDRDEFLSIASHELKTPLTALKLQAQIMIRNLTKNEDEALSKKKITNLVHLLDVQTTRLNRLVDDMLDISRLRTGKLHIELVQTDLREVIESVLEKLASQFGEANLPKPLFIIKENIVGNWDRLRIEQVVTNLLSNASRYGDNKPIKIEAYKDDKFAYIKVLDHGRGIAPDKFDKIFNRFERAGMSAHENSGMGLGLYIAKQIVDAHNGTITLESELQKGTTFTVKLPL